MKNSLMFVLIAMSVIVAVSARGAGLWLYEQGTPDLGTASAGRAALGADASTAGGNPAAMTRLERSQAVLALQGLYIDARFDVDSSTYGGGDGGNAGGVVPAGSMSYVYAATDRLRMGISAGSFFGLGLDYGDNWAGRYYVTEGEMLSVGLNPGVGYRVTDWLSAGAGFTVMTATLDQKVAVNNSAVPGQANMDDGQLKIKDDDVAYGYNLGLLIEPTESTRVGLTYRSKVDLEFKDTVDLNNIGPVLQGVLNLSGLANKKTDIDMTLPQTVMFSAYHQLTPKWAVMGNIGWQEWSEFGKQDFTISDTTSTKVTKDLDYDDTWHFALGAQYRFAPEWLWSVGTAYDTSPVDGADNRTPDLPLDRQIRVGTGLQYDVNEDVTVGCAYELLDAGKGRIKQEGGNLKGDLKGEFDTNLIHFLAVNVIWKF
ncbi:OmpP1/FadL family transporter [Pontiella sulfatireligans]|uniref:Long-chain fatty acid transport protein n=1 Tax=Pontiella sulfatireligans TaxID=2750658 RepID=A0A6C2UGU3_9BACT|nr:OmpP1/FadL family transporter [Pontiella sulfatireligans]VGO18426.1 Long-chain fatty acid transport protein [Pontiella sulfatireligans]